MIRPINILITIQQVQWDEENYRTDGYSELSASQYSEVGDAGRYQPAGAIYVINTGVDSKELDNVINTFNEEMRKNEVHVEAEIYDEEKNGPFRKYKLELEITTLLSVQINKVSRTKHHK